MLFVVNETSKLHTYSAEAPVWHTPTEVAEVRFIMTCVVDGQGKRGNVHIPAIVSVDFPDVVFDGLRLVVEQSIHAETERPRVKKSRRRYISSNGK